MESSERVCPILKKNPRLSSLTLVCKSFVPLPKSARPERIASNLDVFNFELSEADMKELDGLDRGRDGAVTWNPVDAP